MKLTLWRDNLRSEAKPFGMILVLHLYLTKGRVLLTNDGLLFVLCDLYRNWCADLTPILPGDDAIWRQVHVTVP